jgi:hypothetical protein
MKILNLLFYFVSIIPFIALPFLLVNWIRYMKARGENRSRFVPVPAKFPIKSVLFFAVPIAIAISIAEIMTSRSRSETLDFLRDLPGNSKVYVNSQPARDPNAIVSVLKTTSPWFLGHHSSPTKMIRVDIESEKGHLTLELGRDSGYAQEYWVFYPKYGVTSNNEIGKVTTPVFDEY